MVRFTLWHVTLLLWAALCTGVSAALDSDLDCNTVSVVLTGDGKCDEEHNTQACGFDGGDCCECTCWDSEFSCGAKGYNCVDPDAPCAAHGSVFRGLDSLDPGPTSSPTTSPTSILPSDVDDNDSQMASTSGGSSYSRTGVIVGVSAAVVLVGAGMYFYKKRRAGSGRYDATSEYTAAGYTSSL
ncbi:unnamed protein product [Laminaria digitata]